MEETIISKGIPLQICDVFLTELNKVDSQEISYYNLASMLEPFMFAISNCRNRILVLRVIEKIFAPLLENNVTQSHENEKEEEEEDEVINYDPQRGKWVDGGKLHPRTQRAVQKIIDQPFYFPNFNILLYTQEHIFKNASAKETREENRDLLYSLYDKAMKLEPKPENEITFSQQMMINRARSYITLRMQKRLKLS